jgi:hypothetical protein
MDAFFQAYVQNDSNKPLYLMERVRYPCYLFVDIDHVSFDELENFKNTWCRHPGCAMSIRDADETKNHTFGVHIVFKDVVVNSVSHAIQEARKRFNHVDESVYKSGLRMVGSRKNKLLMTTYRPEYFNTSSRLSVADMYKHSILIMCKSTMLPRKTIVVPKHSLQRSRKYTLDFGHIHPNYKNMHVSNIHRHSFDRCIIVNTYERFCTNVEREHNNNHIFIVIHERTKTMHQECFCTCNHTGCQGFVSDPKPIPIKLWTQIHHALKGNIL